MTERLASLSPQLLEIEDDGHRHVGHAGAADGHGHFKLRMVSEAFRGKLPLARHRAIYAALGDMMQTDIHALSIEAKAPGEA
ncbi:MAG TPA: BolA family protein [Xanthomonadaceae bacterium]|nr:BolA family protein [Xanthomonadaceae bacterium]